LLEHGGKDGGAARTRGGDQHRSEARGDGLVEAALVVGIAHAVERDVSAALPLDPHGVVARVRRITVNVERDHSIALPRQAVEGLLMLL
jgi:hypothetical protein